MDLAVISQFIAVLVTILSLLYVVRTTKRLNKTVSKYEPVISNVGEVVSMFRFQKDEEGQIMMDERLANIFTMISSGIAKSMKMSLLGAMSGPARMEKGLKGAIATDVIENKLPLLNLAGDFLGINTKKYISKNPEAIGQLLSLAGPYIPQLKSLMGGNNGNPNVPQVSSNSRAGIG